MYVGVICIFCLVLLLVGPGKTKPLKMRVNVSKWLDCTVSNITWRWWVEMERRVISGFLDGALADNGMEANLIFTSAHWISASSVLAFCVSEQPHTSKIKVTSAEWQQPATSNLTFYILPGAVPGPLHCWCWCWYLNVLNPADNFPAQRSTADHLSTS